MRINHPDTSHVHIAAYNCAGNSVELNHHFEGRITRFDSKKLDKTLLSQIQQTIRNDDRVVVIVNARCDLPEYWLTRLLTTLITDRKTVVCSALSTGIHKFSPLAEEMSFSGTALQLDKLIYHLQPEPSWFETECINPACFAVDLADTSIIFDQLLDDGGSLVKIACDHLLVQPASHSKTLIGKKQPGIKNQKQLPSHPLADLQYRARSYLDQRVLPEAWFSLDSRPVVLHTCMDWDGGVQKWVNDVCAVDHRCHHLVLQSKGEYFRQCYGERYSLMLGGTGGLEIASFELSAPIASTVNKHREYRNLITHVVKAYHVQAVFVSTLIGHSMDCLNTGLPTLRIFHDYFPHWPALLAKLEQDTLSAADLEQALKQTADEPFGTINKEQLAGWQEKLERLYARDNVILIAPDQSVIDNLKKISNNRVYDKLKLVAHGIEPFEPIEYTDHQHQFTILVPGRIGLPKGKQLLDACLPKLTEYRVILLGAGNIHDDYQQYSNVEVIANYQASELRTHLQRYQPDVALILSMVSETFSYTLSEMFQAGIPVVATPCGALKQRIKDGETGIITQVDPDYLVTLIENLVNQPEKLALIRKKLVATPQADIESMVNQYHLLWQYYLEPDIAYRVSPPTCRQEKQIAQQALDLIRINEDLESVIIEQGELIDERTAWAFRLQNHVDELSSAIKHYKTELGHQEQRIQEALENELSTIYNSHSWKLTKPLRDYRRWLENNRNRIRFRASQVGTYPGRVKRSLGARGLRGTALVAYSKLKHRIVKIEQRATVIKLETSFSTFSINTSKTPTISIIIPVYNQFLHTYNCLLSLARLETETGFEVIVVDDCSTDETASKIDLVTGITYYRQKKNSGFIESCNRGASIANGEYYLFLNNDTLVLADWLDSLLAVFETFSDAGIVGSKLVYPDGQLQEAGGIVFSDASGWNYGRGDNPDKPEYNFVREVDYCSGASIVIRKELFDKLGRFDTRYRPAYYEDTDLAFAVRNAGLRVYYQPASTVIHFEGITSGTDLSSGTKRYQVSNQKKFLDKWHDVLKQQPSPGTDIELCRLKNQPKRVLIYDACIPTPDQDSGSLRMVNLIEILQSLGFHVCFMAENLAYMDSYTAALQQTSVECVYHPYVKTPVDYFKDKGSYYDVVIVSRYYIAEPVMPMIRQYCPSATIIFDTVDLHYLREQRLAEFEDSEKLAEAAQKTRSKELSVIEQADITLVVSEYEKKFLSEEINSARVEILSNIHQLHGCRKSYEERMDIMFVGGYQHPPNIDAIVWFANTIFPLIREQLDIQLHIIGSKATKEVELLHGDGVIFQGYVEDIEPFVDGCRIAVAPLRYGAGVKGKVNMSMSYGQPVVATSVAAEGMFAKNGHDILIADTEKEFAEAVIKLYNDKQLWNRLSENGLKNVEQWFSFDAARQAIQPIL